MLHDIDQAISLTDIVICLVDLGVIFYLLRREFRKSREKRATGSRIHRPRKRRR